MKNRIYSISFANSIMEPTLNRIRKEARKSNFFNRILIYNEYSFDKSYWNKYKKWYNSNKRGFGYWAWKPYFIKRALELMHDGDVLVYLDAGCIINPEGHMRFNDYLNMLNTYDIICFEHLDCYENQYTKSSLLDYFGLMHNNAFLKSKQLLATIILFKKTHAVTSMVDEWFDVMHHQPQLIDDSISSISENTEFIENRHDQSVFSILAKRINLKILSQKEVRNEPVDWSAMTEYPFFAAKKREYIWDLSKLKQRIFQFKQYFVKLSI